MIYKRIAIWILNIIGLAFLVYWSYFQTTFIWGCFKSNARLYNQYPNLVAAYPEMARSIVVLSYCNLLNFVLELIGLAYEYYLLHNRRFFGFLLGLLALINTSVIDYTRSIVFDYTDEMPWLLIPDVVWLVFTVVFVSGIVLVKSRLRKKAELHCQIES